MKATINNLTSPEFYAKHAGLKPAAALSLFLAQIVSGLSAYYGIVKVLGDNIAGQFTAVLVAIICEIIVRTFGGQWMVSKVETRHKVKAYDVEKDREGLSRGLDVTKRNVFIFAAVTTSTFTILGGFMFLFNRIHIDEKKDAESVRTEQRTDADATAQRLTAPLMDLVASLTDDIASAEKELKTRDADAKKAWTDYKKTDIWKAETSAANTWDHKGKRSAHLATLEAKKTELNEARKQIASIGIQQVKSADDATTTIITDNTTTRAAQLEAAWRNGAFGFFVGLAAQGIAFYLLWVLACIDVGSGTVKKYTRHFLDGRDLLQERMKIIINRARIRMAYANAQLAEAPVVYKGQALDTRSVVKFIGTEHLEDDGTIQTEPTKKREPAPTEPGDIVPARSDGTDDATLRRVLHLVETQGQVLHGLTVDVERLKEPTELRPKDETPSEKKPTERRRKRRRKVERKSADGTRPCRNCGEGFVGKTKRAVYCSDACRKSWHENKKA